MARCTYCGRRFRSEQAVKAHLKHCPRYNGRKNKESSALGTVPKAAPTPSAMPSFQSGPQVAQPDLSSQLHELKKAMSEAASKLAEPLSPQQRRRKLLQAAKDRVINQYGTPLGTVTPAMRGAAKAAIERELSTFPLEELPFEEIIELAAEIRDRLYVPAFRKQAREREGRQAEQRAQDRKEIEDLGALIRASRRKRLLIQQASHQAQAYCDERRIVGWAHLSVVGDIESRLEEFLTGNESITEAEAIIQSVLDTRFAEADAKLAAARAKEDEKWRDDMLGLLILGGLMTLPMLASKYPDQVLPILSWIEQILGRKPASEGGSAAKKSPETEASSAASCASPRRRRRRTHPVAPSSPESPQWGHPVVEKFDDVQKASEGYTRMMDLSPPGEVKFL